MIKEAKSTLKVGYDLFISAAGEFERGAVQIEDLRKQVNALKIENLELKENLKIYSDAYKRLYESKSRGY